MSESEKVILHGHLLINGKVVSLINADKDGLNEPKSLHVYINLGEIFPRDAMGCYQRMLNVNFKASWESSRIYSIHPQTGNAVSFLRLDMSMDPLTQAQLIIDEIEIGIQELIDEPKSSYQESVKERRYAQHY
ncbi:MAG: hypothetical protein EXR35_00815 [Limnohabitans sp.]|nr:hypothetical protein [Limnohabitans sp.]